MGWCAFRSEPSPTFRPPPLPSVIPDLRGLVDWESAQSICCSPSSSLRARIFAFHLPVFFSSYFFLSFLHAPSPPPLACILVYVKGPSAFATLLRSDGASSHISQNPHLERRSRLSKCQLAQIRLSPDLPVHSAVFIVHQKVDLGGLLVSLAGLLVMQAPQPAQNSETEFYAFPPPWKLAQKRFTETLHSLLFATSPSSWVSFCSQPGIGVLW